jgi:ferric-dicitrate binding protein FerR (iron transport regulator)
MKRTEAELEQHLDQELEAWQGEEMPQAEAAEAAARVRERLRLELAGLQPASSQPASTQPARMERIGAAARVLQCEDFQTMIPAHRAGQLPGPRRLLLEDHVRSCIPCRRALQAEPRQDEAGYRPQGLAALPLRTSGSDRRWFAWAAAAVLALGVGLTTWTLWDQLPRGWGQTARIQALEGELYQVSRDGYVPLRVGQEIPYGEIVRSAKDSGAVVRLEDGTRIEVASRSELELTRRRKGTVIELGRGNIIVEAAKQRDGKLYVSTDDCLVSVTGTIFAVNRGVKGSRVSVVEGQVVVDYGSQEAVLAAGQQVSTHPSMIAVPVAQEIAWSRSVDEYLELLSELSALRQDLHLALAAQGLRYDTALLDRVPATTTFYAAIPNVSTALAEAYGNLQQRVAASPALKRWWEEKVGGEHGEGPTLELAMDKLAQVGAYIGPEVVVSLNMDAEDVGSTLVLIAEVRDAAGLRAFLEEELAKLGQEEDAPRIVVLEDPLATPPAPAADLLIWIRPDLLTLAADPEVLRGLARQWQGATPAPFAATPFRERLAQSYAEGADWLVGADMKAALARAAEGESHPVLERTGILDAEYLILERKPGTGSQIQHRAVLSFDGPRQGLVSWLAAPEPMAALDFISPDAYFVTAVLAKDPALLVEDLFALMDLVSPELRETLNRFEQEHGVSLKQDIAAPLGGEMAVAVDGPILPSPSWKVLVEVYDAARLQSSIQALVDHLNRLHEGGPALRLELRRGGTSPVYSLGSARGALEIFYTYTNGYLLAAPSEALLERAVQYRDTGYNLPRSARFAALLPADGHVNVSGLTYQNLGALLSPLAQSWAKGGGLSEEQRGKLGELAAQTPATLACAYGEEDRIIFVGNSEDGLLSGLLGLSGTLSLERILEQMKPIPKDSAPAGATT